MTNCRICETALVINDTWYQSDAKRKNRICRSCVKAASLARARANPERARRIARKWAADNVDRKRKSHGDWQKANRARQCVSSNLRRALKLAATPPDADLIKIRALFDRARKMSEITGRSWHVDHLVPLTKGGCNHEDNLVVMEGSFNIRKHNHVCPALIRFFGGPKAIAWLDEQKDMETPG